MQKFEHEARGVSETHITRAVTKAQLTHKMNQLKKQMESEGFVETERKKIGRNDACPCGSGKKFKKCHMEAHNVLKHGV